PASQADAAGGRRHARRDRAPRADLTGAGDGRRVPAAVRDVAVFAAAGLAAGWIVRAFLQPVFRLPLLARRNYRGRAVATAGGIVVPFAALLVEAVRGALASIDVGHLIALAANLANQLDRRPGRVTKVGLVVFVVLALTVSQPDRLEGVAVVVGATAALLVDDLRERLMLGDVGANVLGACLGTGVVVC